MEKHSYGSHLCEMNSGKWLTKIHLIHNEVGKAEENRSWVPTTSCTPGKSLLETKQKPLYS